MAKARIGKKSKRVTCSKRYKIEKKVRQHNKKLKKDKSTKDKSKNSKRHKDPGVPNNCPFKEEILKEAEHRRNLLDEERQRRVEKRKKEKTKILDKKRNIGSLSGLVNQASLKTAAFEKKQKLEGNNLKEFGNKKPLENSLKTYYKEVKKVIEASDVVIEVLDARDPLGSRCAQVEEAILNTGLKKKLILMLNKIDLVPKENVEKWLKYLRNEFPAIAFKASTQAQSDHLGRARVPIISADANLSKSASCLGAETLMTLLGNYCRSQDIKTSITIGIVGFPNTGKSSVINSLKRSKACNVGSTPGVTKAMQVIQLDKHIKLLDSPGVVMATDKSSQESAILKNCVKLENLEDATEAVSTILSRCTKEQMMLKYNISSYSSIEEFLQLLAKRLGRLKKGGLPDVQKTAKHVLQDWNSGKITYYTEPPDHYEKSAHISSEVLTELSATFDLSAIADEETALFKGLKKSKQSTDVIVQSEGPVSIAMLNDDNKNDNDNDNDNDNEKSDNSDMEIENCAIKVSIDQEKSKRGQLKDSNSALETDSLNLQLNKSRLKEFKKMKKQRKRADVLAGSLSTALNSGLSSLAKQDDNDAYDFEPFFQ